MCTINMKKKHCHGQQAFGNEGADWLVLPWSSMSRFLIIHCTISEPGAREEQRKETQAAAHVDSSRYDTFFAYRCK